MSMVSVDGIKAATLMMGDITSELEQVRVVPHHRHQQTAGFQGLDKYGGNTRAAVKPTISSS
jgi:hypothetical protein